MADVSKRGKRGARNLTPLEFSKAIQSYLAACSQPQQIDQKRRNQDRNERPGAIEAKENSEYQSDNDEAH